MEGDNRLTLSPVLLDIDDSDYGPYTCVAANKIGEDAETMVLYSKNFFFIFVTCYGDTLPVIHSINKRISKNGCIKHDFI